jgi:pilus assembly protein CpaE
LTGLLIAEDRALAQAAIEAFGAARVFEISSELRAYPNEQTLDMRLRQVRPDVVLLDLGSNFEAAAAVIQHVSGVQPPVQVIGLHRSNDPDILIRALRAGASEFLYYPFEADGQAEAATRIRRLREPEGPAPQEAGKLVAFSSAKPGSGATTLATQCAFSLRRQTGKRVLLVDLDLLSGAVAFGLKISPVYSVVDALERSDQLDPVMWSALAVSSGGLDVLAAPDMAMCEEVEFSRLHDVLEYARMLYDWVVLDLPTVFHRLSLFALSEAEQCYLVSTAELPSLHLARRAVSMLQQLGYGKDRVKMLVNRVNKRTDISVADMEKIFACSVFKSFPNDYHALHRVVTKAESLPVDCDLGRAIEQLTARAAGLGPKDKKNGAAVPEGKPALSES